jgi:hydrogenase nickel incorporation protein HypB
MCGTCGCSNGELRMEAAPVAGAALETLRSDRTEQPEVRRLELDLLSKNDTLAAHNRAHFESHRVLALNLVSSPGAGKTTLLVETLRRLDGTVPAAVIEGDQETAADADRIRATGVRALQINTGRGCHLDAAMIDSAFQMLHFSDGILFIENVGNLVCPAGFDLGEAHKVVIASVTEGEDKPLKYPNLFAAASLMLVSKADLLPHLRFDVDRLIENARRVNPNLEVILLSTEEGTGFPAWLDWLSKAQGRIAAAASQTPYPAHG